MEAFNLIPASGLGYVGKQRAGKLLWARAL